MKQAKMQALFLLAGMEIRGYCEIDNQYAVIRREEPWWLVKTPHGEIMIGRRKRVISISWSGTDVELQVNTLTDDDVTQWETGIHAYSYHKAVEYLTTLNFELKRAVAEKALETQND